MNILGPNELLEDVLRNDMCIGCGACNNLCPYFRSYRGKTNMLFPCTLQQGKCWAYCPKTEVDLDLLSQELYNQTYSADPLGHYLEIKISKAGGRISEENFQAGGTVSALMYFALSKGYIGAAVLTDKEGLLPIPRIVNNPSDVLVCSSSKYSAAPTLSMFNQAVNEGYSKLGVVATPCQVLALAKMLRNPMGDRDITDNLGFTIGLFCTWALDFRSFEDFMKEKLEIKQITKIDIPPPPAQVMEVYTNDDSLELDLEEIRNLIPNACKYCHDMTAEFSDISVGVLEGQTGMNTIIVRTEKGRDLLHEAQKDGYLVVDEIPEENLEHLISASLNKKERAFFKAQEEGLLNSSDKLKRSLLRLKSETLKEICG